MNRMIRDAAEFDRRQNGIRPYSERQMREALEMRCRLRQRDNRIISAFETSQTGIGVGGGSSGQPTYDSTGVFNTDEITAIAYRSMTFDFMSGRQASYAKAMTSIAGGMHVSYNIMSNIGQMIIISASAGIYSGLSKGFLSLNAIGGGGAGFLLSMPHGIQSYERECLPYLACWLESRSITNTRIWVGFFTGNPGTMDDPTGHLAGFRFSHGVNSDKWSACTKSGGAINAIDTGVTVSSSTKYLTEIIFRSTSLVEFRINGSVVASTGTSIPSSGMGEQPGLYLNGKGGASNVNCDVNFLYVSQN